MYAYRLKSTGESSSKFGPCEVCNRHASEVFLQTEMLGFDNPLNPIGPSYTYYQARHGAFGHKECLQGLQR